MQTNPGGQRPVISNVTRILGIRASSKTPFVEGLSKTESTELCCLEFTAELVKSKTENPKGLHLRSLEIQEERTNIE